MRIKPDDKLLQYCGRIDFSNPEAPVFVFPCTYVKMRFTGNNLKVIVKNRSFDSHLNNYLGCVIDGRQIKFKLSKEKVSSNYECAEECISIPVDDCSDGNDKISEHEVMIFKRQDSCHEIIFLGFEIDDNEKVLSLPPLPERRIEVYGDSVSAGEVSEAVDRVGKKDPFHHGEYSNSYYSYSWLTARKLGAQIHDIAQGGIALLDGTGWYYFPKYVGMETAWDSVHYSPALGTPTKWDFNKYRPQVVIVAFGQNDSHPEDYMKEDYEGEKATNWRTHYKMFLENLRSTYPEAQIVCTTTLLEHHANWDRAIDDVVKEMNDEKITHFLYTRNGKGTPGHLRIPEAEEMAEELSAYINTLDIMGW